MSYFTAVYRYYSVDLIYGYFCDEKRYYMYLAGRYGTEIDYEIVKYKIHR